jgi:hypothetical protein
MADHQMSFTEDYKFLSACSHCGKPMAGMSIDRYESVGPGQVEERNVFRVWIDPKHECTYLKIEEPPTGDGVEHEK